MARIRGIVYGVGARERRLAGDWTDSVFEAQLERGRETVAY